MEGSEAALKQTPESGSRTGVDLSSLTVPFAVAAAAAAAIVALLHSTFGSMVSIWMSSGTYAHGFFILPISLYLLWDERERLEGARARPTYAAVPALVVAGFGWLICRLAGVNVLEQYAATAMAVLAIWAVLGHDVTRRILFPLGFLFLSVPIGDALLPRLIDQTAEFTVAALRLSGVAVLQDGNSLTLSTGRWSVVEACSGLRYLIASVTLGFLYAHLSYRSWWRRGLCLLASIVVPIVANWFRAYMIVMIGHLSDMRLAVGIDHLIYGWVFFGVVVLVFFWVGSFFREDIDPSTERSAVSTTRTGASTGALITAAVIAVVTVAVWPVWAARAGRLPETVPSSAALELPERLGAFSRVERRPVWAPFYENADITMAGVYQRDGDGVGLHVACYLYQTHGHELTSSRNRFVARGTREYRKLEERQDRVSLVDREVPITAVRLDGVGPVLAWKWLWIGGTATTSALEAKQLELTGKLLGREPPACGVIVFTSGRGERSSQLLTDFLGEGLEELESSLDALPRPE